MTLAGFSGLPSEKNRMSTDQEAPGFMRAQSHLPEPSRFWIEEWMPFFGCSWRDTAGVES